jgi:hypothetical protein
LIFGLLKVCYECSSFAKNFCFWLKRKHFRATWTCLYCDFTWHMAVGIFNCLKSGTSIISDVTQVSCGFSRSVFVCKFQYNKTLYGTLADRTMEISTLKNLCCTNISPKKSALACSKILIQTWSSLIAVCSTITSIVLNCNGT